MTFWLDSHPIGRFYIKLQQDKPKSFSQKKNINLIPYVILILSYKNINNTYFPFVSF